MNNTEVQTIVGIKYVYKNEKYILQHYLLIIEKYVYFLNLNSIVVVWSEIWFSYERTLGLRFLSRTNFS